MNKFEVQSSKFKVGRSLRTQSAIMGFTMIEIAICLAVIGFALVAIIGVLPIGMNVQKENREETVINFDATYLMDAIRSGAQGLNNLTNYVNSITVTSTLCDSNAVPTGGTYVNIYTGTGYSINGTSNSTPALTNGAIIVSLLSTPKYVYAGNPLGSYYSNSVTADIRAVNGVPTDQAVNQTSKDFAFTYRVSIELVPNASYPYAAYDTNGVPNPSENFSAPGLLVTNAAPLPWAGTVPKNLQANLTDIRLRFRWPVLPGNRLGNGSQIFRTTVSGGFRNLPTSFFSSLPPPTPLAFYLIQPQAYATAQ